MRRIVTTLMAACLLFFVACSDEGDDVTIYNGDTFTSDYKANQMYSTLSYMKVLPVSRKWQKS